MARAFAEAVVGIPGADLTESALRYEVLTLQRRVQKLAALLRLALAVRPRSRRAPAPHRVPDGAVTTHILRAVEAARRYIPLRGILRFLHLSRSQCHGWGRRQRSCALDEQEACPRRSTHRLTRGEVGAVEDMVTSPAYRHVPIRTLAVLAQRLGTVCASLATWYSLVRMHGWRRPRLRVHPPKPTVGLGAARPDEIWHIDTTVIRLLDGTRAYLHAVIDNFSRRILAWHVAGMFAPVNSVSVLLEATRQVTASGHVPVALSDAGVENVNAQIDALLATGVLRRLLAMTELRVSNSMIEAWWRSLKHQWLFLHALDSVATVRRLVAYYVDEHNRVLPHAAFRGQTPDEMYRGTGEAIPAELTARAAAVHRARLQANLSASCATCLSLNPAV